MIMSKIVIYIKVEQTSYIPWQIGFSVKDQRKNCVVDYLFIICWPLKVSPYFWAKNLNIIYS